MANTNPSYLAGGTIRPSRFVKITAAHTVSESDANEASVGVSQEGGNQPPLSDLVSTINAAVSGETLKVYGLGDECLLELGDTVTAGQYLKSDADGKGVPVATTGTTLQLAGALALDAGAAGDLLRVQVLQYPIRPAIV